MQSCKSPVFGTWHPRWCSSPNGSHPMRLCGFDLQGRQPLPPTHSGLNQGVRLSYYNFQISPRTPSTISTHCFAETSVTVSSDHILCTFVCLIFDVWTLSLPISVAPLHKNQFCSCGTVLRMSSKPGTQLCSRLYNFHIHVLWHWQEKSLTYNEVYFNYETKCSR